jgi:hypothetical protein
MLFLPLVSFATKNPAFNYGVVAFCTHIYALELWFFIVVLMVKPPPASLAVKNQC